MRTCSKTTHPIPQELHVTHEIVLQTYFSRSNLKRAWKEVYLSKSIRKRKSSKGVDGISIENFKKNEDAYLDYIHRQLQGGFFRFDPLLSYKQFKKGKKKSRDIQAPTVKDRIVQKIVNDYLVERYFLEDFKKIGIVGSVKGNTLRDTIKKILSFYNDGYIYVLKTDVSDYFPSIRVSRLKRIIGHYIKDGEAKKIILDYLSVSKLPGIPQGPALSPLMANLYLRQLDVSLSKRKTIRHIRYVDDILIFCKTKNIAEKTFVSVEKRTKEVGLRIHPLGSSKTLLGKFDEGGIDVLGIIYHDNKLLIKKDNLKRFIDENIAPLSRIGNLLQNEDMSVNENLDSLIQRLNYRIIGWSEAYSFCDIKDEYKKLDTKIEENLLTLFNNLRQQKRILYSNAKKQRKISGVKKFSDTKLKPIH